jgi:hypothetical protein
MAEFAFSTLSSPVWVDPHTAETIFIHQLTAKLIHVFHVRPWVPPNEVGPPLIPSTRKDSVAVVESFFQQVKFAGLLLPDGWYGGRPMENRHRLTFVAQRPKRLLIELDDRILLSFSGDPTVQVTKTEHAMTDGTPTLVVSGFRQAVVDYLEYVNDSLHVRPYAAGAVSFVAAV